MERELRCGKCNGSNIGFLGGPYAGKYWYRCRDCFELVFVKEKEGQDD